MLIDVARNLNRRLPGGLRRALLVRRRARFWLDAGIVFIHVPKAAGTSFNEALYGRFMGHPHARDIKRWAPAAVGKLPMFGITRNPWDRLVSAWRFARQGRGVGETYRAGMWQAERYQIPEFETFERFVKEWLAPRDVTKLDGVFQPQWMFLCDRRGNLLVDHVGTLEDLGPTLDFVRRVRGVSLQIRQANRSGETVDYRRFYTPELADLVGHIYEADAARFGYAF
ncbi:sulfotransferase family 2 domain-containing protein [Sphingosinicella terrae]|uniref:sulfotransferase family 2 domain-containing protein n=1 Tax=Sphingosinicella terrae TaxID=2172047 RepID=UPI000E0D0CB9|nr:sulfotransferase family 2 domain-containing protein [Sphingosinicella terrae]